MSPTWTRALVTGASAGIGNAMAHRLAAEGTDVVVVAHDEDRLGALASELAGRHRVEVEVLVADLADPTSLAAVEERVASADAPVDLLVNNAGFGTYGPFAELDVDEEEREIRLNVVALVRLTHAAAAAMAGRGGGSILNVSSLASRSPTPRNATYSATKAFVSHFSEALHEELKGAGVVVTVSEPGFTRTEFQERAGLTQDAGMPDFVWQSADEVAEASIEGARARKALVVPGLHNQVAGTLAGLAPRGLRRRAVAMMSGRF